MTKRTFRAKQSLGQNFLVDENIARKIVERVGPRPEDTVLEIGPGFGILTKYLLPAVKHLIAVEIDSYLVSRLRQTFPPTQLELIHGDFLEQDLSAFVPDEGKIRIVGNIPYHITSPVIFKVFEMRSAVADLILMLQREVAERIVAEPGNKQYGILSVFSQTYSEPQILLHVSRRVFSPRPDVDSAVVRWDFGKAPGVDIEDEQVFRTVVRASFQQRRKMLRKSLQQISPIAKNLAALNMDLTRRPEELSVAEFTALANKVTELWKTRT